MEPEFQDENQRLCYLFTNLEAEEELSVKMDYSYLISDKDIELLEFPMKPKVVAKEQQKDKELKRRVKANLDKYELTKVETDKLITKNGKFVVPTSLQMPIISWYHDTLAHPGETRTEATIRQCFTWKGMREQVQKYCQCRFSSLSFCCSFATTFGFIGNSNNSISLSEMR